MAMDCYVCSISHSKVILVKCGSLRRVSEMSLPPLRESVSDMYTYIICVHRKKETKQILFTFFLTFIVLRHRRWNGEVLCFKTIDELNVHFILVRYLL
jgi:hypothetical protein